MMTQAAETSTTSLQAINIAKNTNVRTFPLLAAAAMVASYGASAAAAIWLSLALRM